MKKTGNFVIEMLHQTRTFRLSRHVGR